MTRLPTLDLLRFVAVTLVLGRHIGHSAQDHGWLIASWQRGGWIGVDLFFVLSGFLVAGLLFQDGRIGRFYLRRAWKIYPSFYVLLGITFLMYGWPDPSRRGFGELFFVQNYLGSLWGHTWSLAVEEHFYLVLPWLLWGLRGRWRALPWIVLAVMLACLSGRLWIADQPFTAWTHLVPTHLRFDALFVGVLLSYGWHLHRARMLRLTPYRGWLWGMGWLVLLPPFVWTLETTPYLYTLGLTQLSLGSACLVLAGLLTPPPTHHLLLRLAWIGSCSYSIYLWHLPVINWLTPLVLSPLESPPFWLAASVYLAGSYLVGIEMARMVEFPALRLRDRFRLSSRGISGAAPTSARS
jgi:peptidoglycan/LPS O-acetylase OafA/YrhL